jgi:iron complex outermembrane receptor protein
VSLLLWEQGRLRTALIGNRRNRQTPGRRRDAEGLGDSRNATLFYENERFGARLAYNWRDGFLEQLVTSGQGGDPVYRSKYEQLDLRLSFMITDQIQTFLEGTNVLGEENITTGRFDNQVLGYVDTGARWALGVRTDF